MKFKKLSERLEYCLADYKRNVKMHKFYQGVIDDMHLDLIAADTTIDATMIELGGLSMWSLADIEDVVDAVIGPLWRAYKCRWKAEVFYGGIRFNCTIPSDINIDLPRAPTVEVQVYLKDNCKIKTRKVSRTCNEYEIDCMEEVAEDE